jgi:hypothetical protein
MTRKHAPSFCRPSDTAATTALLIGELGDRTTLVTAPDRLCVSDGRHGVTLDTSRITRAALAPLSVEALRRHSACVAYHPPA